ASPIVNEQPVPKAISFTPVVEKKSTESKELPNIQLSDEISINFPDTSKSPQEKKIKGGLFGKKKEKETKPAQPKQKSKFWQKKNDGANDIIQGAAANMQQQAPPPIQFVQHNFMDDVTQLEVNEGAGTGLRYVGN